MEELHQQNESLKEDVQVQKEQHNQVVAQNEHLAQLTQTLTHEKEELIHKVCLVARMWALSGSRAVSFPIHGRDRTHADLGKCRWMTAFAGLLHLCNALV